MVRVQELKVKILQMFKKKKSDKSKNDKKPKKQSKKPEKLRKNTGLKILKVLVWVVFVFIFVRGVINIVRPDPVKGMEKSQQAFIEKMSKENSLKNKAFAFTEAFVKEYFTHVPNVEDDYKKRLVNFLPDYLLQELKYTGDTIVLNAKAYDIEQYSDSQFNVYVCARVQYKKQTSVIESDIYFKVPVKYNNNFVVEDFPNMVAQPSKGTSKNQEFEGKSVETDLNSDINSILAQFFKAYYELPQTQINYFLDSSISQDVKGLDGRFKFNKIEKSNVFYEKDSNNNFIAIVKLQISDVEGTLINQNYNLKLTKKDGKYYITEMNTRSINIKDSKEK